MAETVSEARPGPDNGEGGALSKGPEIFREAALARYVGLEELDTMVKVTSPRLWLLLGVLVGVVLAIVSWLILAKAPDTVTGRGLLIPSEGLFEVGLDVQGRVLGVLVNRGDQVEAGDPLAVIEGPEGKQFTLESTVAGEIVELLVKQGAVHEPGAPAVRVLPVGGDLSALLFIPDTEGKGIRPGMPAEISPVTAAPAQYGSIVGVVTSVSSVPVTLARAKLILGDANLAQSLLQAGPVLEVRVKLAKSDETPSGYEWTIGEGPPFAIDAATELAGKVILSESRRIEGVL